MTAQRTESLRQRTPGTGREGAAGELRRLSGEAQREAPNTSSARVVVRGKFLYRDGRKLWIKGVTYGTFAPDEDGYQFPPPHVVQQDFESMAAAGFNTVRVYTVPPRWLLDLAHRCDLLLLVGLPWEQHVCFLDDSRLIRDIVSRCRAAVRDLRGHAALLAWSIGNEIPATIVRWHGKARIEAFLARLFREVKRIDPDSLVTYVNYPTTEYLELPFLDFVSFNVFLEDEARQRAYLRRLHNLSGERPVLIAEAGLDSLRNGEDFQASVLDWQIRGSFADGCCGICIFAWTDQWYRGGHQISDWKFGLTTTEREPKPALDCARRALSQMPFGADGDWPRFSVVVCSFNGEATIRDTLDGLQHLDYPRFEVIVVDDGSTDATAAIAAGYPFRVISTENRGLSAARNLGWESSTAEIIAYLDDDAYPDPDWLRYLALAYREGGYAGVGGPNLAPPGDGWRADCVACAPGGPVHVLLSDTVAEHIPGCNMSFRRSVLQSVGGFDRRFRVAGDDVDICWRVRQEIGDIGFSAAAMVWHHRRNSLRTYWKQQRGYGRAEALLAQKWPQKYNASGHLSWGGKIYGAGLQQPLAFGRGRLYQGVWGSAPFQSLYEPAPGVLGSLTLQPEWYLLIAVCALFAAGGLLWTPLAGFLLPLALMLATTLAQAVQSAGRALRERRTGSGARRFSTVVLLHLMQPLARLIGRFGNGLHPWRRQGLTWPKLPPPVRGSHWREHGESAPRTLARIEELLRRDGWPVRRGGDFDRWDIEIQPSIMARVRLETCFEEHGSERQMLRYRLAAGIGVAAGTAIAVPLALAVPAYFDDARTAAALLLIFAGFSAWLTACAWRRGISALERALREVSAER